MIHKHGYAAVAAAFIVSFFLVLTAGLLASCSSLSPSTAPTQAGTSTPTITATLPPAPTLTTTPTPTGAPTSTATPTPTSTRTSTPTPTLGPDWTKFDGKDVSLAIPKKWTIVDMKHDSTCIPGLADCVIRITHPDDASTKITLMRLDFTYFGSEMSAAVVDESLWSVEPLRFKDVKLDKEVRLISKEEVQVGGQPGIMRVFSEPWVDNKIVRGTLYFERVLVVSGKAVYHLYLSTPKEKQFTEYQGIMQTMIGSIRFK